jgi:hypothetical protein
MFSYPLYLNIYHVDWNDKIILNDEGTIIRTSGNKDTGKYIINDNLLLIDWDNWDKDYFLSENNIDYYQILYNFNLYISIITLIDNNNSGLFIMNSNYQKIYKIHNLESYGSYKISQGNLIINNKSYIYFNNKYYEESYFNEYYEIVNTINEETNTNNKYLLFKKDNSCYINYNFNKSGNYEKYKNMINIVFDGLNNIYCKNNKDNYYYLIKKDNNNEIYIKNFTFNNINTKESVLFINNSNYVDQLFYIIEYFINLNTKCILFDNIDNKYKNNLYSNSNRLNIIYYENINEVENIINFLDISIEIQIYINSKQKIHISKINIKNIYLNDIYTNAGIRYNLLDCNIQTQNNYKKNIIGKWNLLNYDKFKTIIEYKFDEIPKIMHFIWIGPNEIPNIYIDYIESWITKHSDWKFCFWNDNNIPKLINQEYYDNTDVYAMKADILRYELLYFMGGVYVDCDFICFKNIENIIDYLILYLQYLNW